MEWLTDPQAWIAFVTLVLLELVLGIDNIVFITILAGRLPGDQPKKARLVGLGLAMLMRIALAPDTPRARQHHRKHVADIRWLR